jgi:hypothetical protein
MLWCSFSSRAGPAAARPSETNAANAEGRAADLNFNPVTLISYCLKLV